jgi:small conductance mechanosensitive channel
VGYLIIALTALTSVGLDIRPVLATAGVASLAIGFGAQNLVKDVISGFFIILEDQYGQGDIVNLDGDEGSVENLNLRTTQLRNSQGTLIIKTNGSITVVRNMSKDWSRIDFRIGVAYNSDLTKVLKALDEEGHELRKEFPNDVLDRPEVLGVESFNESDITVRMLIRSRPGMQFDLRRALNRKIKERFDRDKIEIPFPQRVHWQARNNA